MDEKSKELRCWCCSSFLARFDDGEAPNKIMGGICLKKRKECNPYTEKCEEFYIQISLLPKTKELHSVDSYAKRNGINLFDMLNETDG